MELTLYPLGEYCELLDKLGLLAIPLPEGGDLGRTVELVSCNSKEVVPGTLFVCKGAHFKPDFLAEAASRGAFAYVSETPYPQVGLPCLCTSDLRRAMAHLAVKYYNDPSRQLKVIGITGTKGKSTTAYYLKDILDGYLAPGRCGVISSIGTYDGVEEFESHLTTPEPLELQKHFANALSAGLEYVVMEVSSQALKYHRSLCTDFAAACFLNIGYDHISPIEHTDFEDYFSSKLRIFQQGKVNCVNLDCDHAERVLAAAREAGKPLITFSQKDPSADVFADRVRKRGEDILFRVRTGRYEREFRLTMPGLFNVENALAAIAVCEGLEIPERFIYAGLERARVPGRMEVFASAGGTVTAIVDYAHNRMSFEALFRSARAEYPGRRIVTVFGCPGLKALDRRRDLGEISGKYSDLVVLTEEDSGEEDTLSICGQIAAHVAEQGCKYLIEPNRGEAIRQAILSCREPSVLLITGKGEETRQKRGREYIDTPSDVDYVHAFLGEYDMIRGLDGMEEVRGLLAALPALERYAGKRLVVQCPAVAGADVLQDVSALRALGVRVRVCESGGGLAAALEDKAELLVLFSPAGLTNLERMDRKRAEELLETGGVPEALTEAVQDCVRALDAGGSEAAVLDSAGEHALLLYLLDRQTPGMIISG